MSRRAAVATGGHDVADAFVQGQVETLVIDTDAAAESELAPKDRAGLSIAVLEDLAAGVFRECCFSGCGYRLCRSTRAEADSRGVDMTGNRLLAVVTGASSGIGFELARQLALNGYGLVIAAEDKGIEEAAVELRTAGDGTVPVEAVRVDLATAEGVQRLHTALATRAVHVAILNAGVGWGGAFVETELAAELKMIDLNVSSTVHLTKLLLRDMVADDEGRILITSSIASTMPGSFQAVYNATKSFLQSFAEALQEELEDSNVVVTSLMPGPTETNFFHRARMDATPVGQAGKDDPAEVARQGLAALMAGKDRQVAASLKTRAQELAAKMTPDKVKAAMHRKLAEPEE
ncbi:SDR family NAD(P)-dependent oxidoreductase [Kribbella sp. NPDC026611]|uniref:SDR family NAD(P)-dependent oxidoreductase n=1 Tax=Kribbella sp. NPDC026611 TaxID=3154911 RepID=UPI0033F22C34